MTPPPASPCLSHRSRWPLAWPLPARIHGHAVQLHRPVFAGRGRPGDAHRRRRHDLLRPGGLRRRGRLCHRLGLHLAPPRPRSAPSCPRPAALGRAGARPAAHLRGRLGLGAITLKLSGHYLPLCTIAWGLSLYFLFGNLEFLGGHDRHRPACRRWRSAASRWPRRGRWAADLGGAAAGAVGAAQPARLARGPRRSARSRAAA